MLITRAALFALSLLLSPASVRGICPDKPAPTDPCTPVNDWNGLKNAILGVNESVVLCPFNVTKTDREPLLLEIGVTVSCRKANDLDECTISGVGEHIRSISQTEVSITGLTFKGSDEHAVYIAGGVDTNVHTFCDCTFEKNRQVDGQRGGAFKTEEATGSVNLVSCTFRQNYCASYGGAIYTRSNFTSIVDSTFVENTATGPGGAIAAANYADLSIEGSVFNGNLGQNSYAIVVRPEPGPMVVLDGGDNLSINNGDCDGVYDWSVDVCTEFVGPPSSPAPATTSVPSYSPSGTPSIVPTYSPTTSAPTVSMAPSNSPSDTPSIAPTVSVAPSLSPTISMAPSSVAESKCGDIEEYTDAACLAVNDWNSLVDAIKSASDTIVLCAFSIMNDSDLPLLLNKDMSVYCPSQSCVIYGPSTHLRVEGDTRVLVSGFTFTGSQQTAVQIQTKSYSAVTTFCNCAFNNNKRHDDGGGAIRSRDDAGEINLVGCTLHKNAGTTGGAIFSRAFRLNIISSSISGNEANETGGSIYMGWSAHLLIRGSSFFNNKAENDNISIIVLPKVDASLKFTEIQGTFVDAGDNTVSNDGRCKGFYVEETAECYKFLSLPASPTLVYPYVPGELSVYDSETGILLASGLSIRQIAKTGEPVIFGGSSSGQNASSIPFHKEPDGAAVVPTKDGGWMYISNSEQSKQPVNGTGGVYGLEFDSEGEIRDYRPLLLNSTRNCNGGLTPWLTWVSCEEVAGGQCWQVDPFGSETGRVPQRTSIVEEEGGSFEAFTYDDRNASRPCFFVTEDHERGALRRWCPDSYLLNETWNMLHGNGTRDYLKIINGTNKFEWTPSLQEGRASAAEYFPFTEGISHDGKGLLYFVSKHIKVLFIANLDTLEYRSEFTNNTKLMIGDGIFDNEPDHVLLTGNDDVLYFTEDGGRPGVYGRKKSTGEYFALMEGQDEKYKHDEATGLAWSPDWKRIYVCIQDKGVLFEITRDDGLPFDHDANQLRLKHHPK